MSHLDPDQIALLALGESVASLADCAHLRGCEACTAELSELQSTVQVARTAAAEDDALEAPPERVWESIHAELGLGTALGTPPEPTVVDRGSDESDAAQPAGPAASVAVSDTGSAASAPASAPASSPAAAPASSPAASGGHVSDAAVSGDRSRRRGVRAAWALAAAFVLVAGVGIAGWVASTVNAPAQVAAAVLDPFPDHPGATGAADVEQARDGTRQLVVTVDSEAVPDTYREVWLIRNDAGALISLGVLEGDSGTFTIPDGVDLEEYGLVDVSVEPIDGDPAHSGDSIVRGALSAA